MPSMSHLLWHLYAARAHEVSRAREGLLLHHDRPVGVPLERDVLAVRPEQRFTVGPQHSASHKSPVVVLHQDLASGLELGELPLQLRFHPVSRAAPPVEVPRTRLPTLGRRRARLGVNTLGYCLPTKTSQCEARQLAFARTALRASFSWRSVARFGHSLV